jgi:hypothetical protein
MVRIHELYLDLDSRNRRIFRACTSFSHHYSYSLFFFSTILAPPAPYHNTVVEVEWDG